MDALKIISLILGGILVITGTVYTIFDLKDRKW